MENKQRIIQELVPGKQITLAHIIANPDPILYQKLGLNPAVEYAKAAIGVLTVSPAETAIIMADIGIKSAGVAWVCRQIFGVGDRDRHSVRSRGIDSGDFAVCGEYAGVRSHTCNPHVSDIYEENHFNGTQ